MMADLGLVSCDGDGQGKCFVAQCSKLIGSFCIFEAGQSQVQKYSSKADVGTFLFFAPTLQQEVGGRYLRAHLRHPKPRLTSSNYWIEDTGNQLCRKYKPIY
jgi:hypothetical protein